MIIINTSKNEVFNNSTLPRLTVSVLNKAVSTIKPLTVISTKISFI